MGTPCLWRYQLETARSSRVKNITIVKVSKQAAANLRATARTYIPHKKLQNNADTALSFPEPSVARPRIADNSLQWNINVKIKLLKRNQLWQALRINFDKPFFSYDDDIQIQCLFIINDAAKGIMRIPATLKEL